MKSDQAICLSVTLHSGSSGGREVAAQCAKPASDQARQAKNSQGSGGESAEGDDECKPLLIHPPSLCGSMLFECVCLSSIHSQLRKVFSVQGPYPVIRAALWARGWVERRLPRPVQRVPHCHGDEVEDGGDGETVDSYEDKVQRASISEIHF